MQNFRVHFQRPYIAEAVAKKQFKSRWAVLEDSLAKFAEVDAKVPTPDLESQKHALSRSMKHARDQLKNGLVYKMIENHSQKEQQRVHFHLSKTQKGMVNTNCILPEPAISSSVTIKFESYFEENSVSVMQTPDARTPAVNFQTEISPNRFKRTRLLFLLVPFISTIAATAELAMGLNKLDETRKLLGSIPMSGTAGFVLLIIIPTTYFIQVVNMNCTYTLQGIDMFLHYMDKNKILRRTEEERKDWPVLSKSDERIALLLASPFLIFSSFAASIVTGYFVNELPKIYGFENKINLVAWRGFSDAAAIMGALEAPLKEGPEIYSAIRRTIQRYRHGNDAKANKKISSHSTVAKILGLPLSVIGGLDITIEVYFAICYVCSVKNEDAKRFLLLFTTIFTGIADGLFSGQMTMDAIDDFIRKIRRGFSRQDVYAFLTTSAFSIFIAEGMRQLIILMMTDPEVALPFGLESQPTLVSTIGTGTAIREGINSVYNNYSFFRNLPSNISNGFSYLKSGLSFAAEKISSGFSRCRNRHVETAALLSQDINITYHMPRSDSSAPEQKTYGTMKH